MTTCTSSPARQTARGAVLLVVLLAAMLCVLSSCAEPGSPHEDGQTGPTSQVEPDENEPDVHEAGENERDEREQGENEHEADEDEDGGGED